jgi:hypothetical protein
MKNIVELLFRKVGRNKDQREKKQRELHFKVKQGRINVVRIETASDKHKIVEGCDQKVSGSSD